MASISSPRLVINRSSNPGMSSVKVNYEITFNGFDKSIDQPYTEIVRLIGDDTGVSGDPAAAAPDDMLVQALATATVRARRRSYFFTTRRPGPTVAMSHA